MIPGFTRHLHLIESCRRVLLGESSTPKYGCLMAMIPADRAQAFIKAARRVIPSGDLHENGYEDEPHVTVLYGFNPSFDPNELREVCQGFLPIRLTVKGISTFDCPEYDVIKLDVESNDLHELNRELRHRFVSEVQPSKYPDYHPHLTLAYVRKNASFDRDAAQGLIGQTFVIPDLLYSLPDKQGRVIIP